MFASRSSTLISLSLDMFFGNFRHASSFYAHAQTLIPSPFSPSLVGTEPTLVSIDGGVVQTTNQSFDLNGESNLDLQYAMALVDPQPITLYQVGDLEEGMYFPSSIPTSAEGREQGGRSTICWTRLTVRTAHPRAATTRRRTASTLTRFPAASTRRRTVAQRSPQTSSRRATAATKRT